MQSQKQRAEEICIHLGQRVDAPVGEASDDAHLVELGHLLGPQQRDQAKHRGWALTSEPAAGLLRFLAARLKRACRGDLPRKQGFTKAELARQARAKFLDALESNRDSLDDWHAGMNELCQDEDLLKALVQIVVAHDGRDSPRKQQTNLDLEAGATAAIALMWLARADGPRQLLLAQTPGLIADLASVVGDASAHVVVWSSCCPALSNIFGRGATADQRHTALCAGAQAGLASQLCTRLRLACNQDQASDNDSLEQLVLALCGVLTVSWNSERPEGRQQILTLLDDSVMLTATLPLLARMCGPGCAISMKGTALQAFQMLDVCLSPTLQGFSPSIDAAAKTLERWMLLTVRGKPFAQSLLSAFYEPTLAANPSFAAQKRRLLEKLRSMTTGERPLASRKLQDAVDTALRLAAYAPATQLSPTSTACITCNSPGCSNSSLGNRVLQRCAGCKQMWYCGAACQTKHWDEGHKKECRKLRKAAASEGVQKAEASASGNDALIGRYFARTSKSRLLVELPPASTRFHRVAEPRVCVLISSEARAVDEPPPRADWHYFRGEAGAAAFREQGFPDGDIVLLAPGAYSAPAWGLNRPSAPVGAAECSIELIGVGRPGSVCIVSNGHSRLQEQDRIGLCTTPTGLDATAKAAALLPSVALRILNLAFDGSSTIAVWGLGNRAYLEVEHCQLTGADRHAVGVACGVARIAHCTIKAAGESGISLGFRMDDSKASLMIISGVQSRPELNGTLALLEGDDEANAARCRVKLATGKAISLKRDSISWYKVPSSWPACHELEANEITGCGTSSARHAAVQLSPLASAVLKSNSIHDNFGHAVTLWESELETLCLNDAGSSAKAGTVQFLENTLANNFDVRDCPERVEMRPEELDRLDERESEKTRQELFGDVRALDEARRQRAVGWALAIWGMMQAMGEAASGFHDAGLSRNNLPTAADTDSLPVCCLHTGRSVDGRLWTDAECACATRTLRRSRRSVRSIR